MPPCLSGGCPIGDVAGSIPLNRKVGAFLEAESLEMSPGYAPVQRRILEESGLLAESPRTLLAMKAVLAEYRDWDSRRKSKG